MDKKIKKMGKKKIFLFPLLILGIFFILFNLSVLTISFRFDIPYYYTSKAFLRQGVLLTLNGLTQIYDPAETKVAATGLNGFKRGKKGEGYGRIEKYFENLKGEKGFQAIEIKNEKIIKSKYDFMYQPYGEPRLFMLRREYNLDEVVSGAKTEFEAMIRLRNWTRSQFRRKDYQPRMKKFDGLEILLRNVRNPKNEPHQRHQYRPCHFFPLLYSQVLLSMGYQSRLVRISTLAERGYDGHGMTEVWSNQFRKWITMDADLNLHYEREEIPLNLLEVHNELYRKDATSIKIIRGRQTSGDEEAGQNIEFSDMISQGNKYKENEGLFVPSTFNIQDMIRYHTYIQIMDMRNDWMTNHYFRGHPMRSDQATLFWKDENQPPVFHFKQETNQIADFYWTLNQTEIWAKNEKRTDGKIALAFNTFTPNFRNFEILINGFKKIKSTDPFFEWKIQPGVNRLQVRSVNQYGMPGIESWVEVKKQSS